MQIDYTLPFRVTTVTKDRFAKEFKADIAFTWDQVVQVEENCFDDFNLFEVLGKATLIMDTGRYCTLENFEEFYVKWIGYIRWSHSQVKKYYLPLQ